MRKILMTSILICISLHISAQSATMDSLLNLLKTAKEDTNKANILYELSQESNQENMLKYAIPALELAEKLNLKNVIAGAANNVGLGYNLLGNGQLALKYLTKSLKIKREIGASKLNIAVTLNNIGMAYGGLGNFPMELYYYKEGLKIREEALDTFYIANSLVSIGANYQKQDEFILALEYYLKAKELLKKSGKKLGQARTLNNIGGVYLSLGDIPSSLINYYEGLKISEEISDKPGISSCLKNIGLVYETQNDYSNALLNHYKCLKIREEINDQGGIAYALVNIGSVYYALGDLTKSLDYYNRGLKIHQELAQKRGVVNTIIKIADIYKDNGQYREALAYCQQALNMLKEIKQPLTKAKTLNTIGNIYLMKKQFKMAQDYCMQSLKLSKEIRSPDDIRKSSESLSKIFSSMGKFKEAFEAQLLFKQMSDSINNSETRKSIVKRQMQYDFEKREALTRTEHEKRELLSNAEINRQKLIRNSTLGGVGIAVVFSFFLIRSSIRKRKTSFEKQVAEVETKALRSQMNPHFIYNSLNSIDDYILNNDIKNSSIYINKFSRLMRRILESSRKEEVSLKEDMESLELYMQLENLRMQNKVECTMEVSPEINTENVLIPPLLLQPFIENSFKHAFYEIATPKLEITISLKDDMLCFTVTDNGNGRENVQKTEPETAEKRKSLGMTVTRERLDIVSKIRKTRAYFTIEDLMDSQKKVSGTRVILFVPATFAF